MDWIQQWQSKLNKQNGVAPLVRTGGSRHTGLAALPHRNIHLTEYSCAMKSHFRKFGNQMSGSGNHLYNYASLLA